MTETGEQPTVLFVDDEPNILKALRRLFMDEDWNLLFADSGQEGLEVLEREPVDLVVSDFRMPGMDGMTFLREVSQRHPDVVRFFLSGYAEKDSVMTALAEGTAQQILSKPWDEQELRQAISKSLRQRQALQEKGSGLQQLINGIPSLPALPEIYLELRKLLEDKETVSLDTVATIVDRDAGITTALLRWANSPIFGQMSKVDTSRRAIVVLGLDVVEGLVLCDTVSRAFMGTDVPGFQFEAFQRHSMAVAMLARQLVQRCPEATSELRDQVFTAGLMHDIGILVEARFFPQQLRRALIKAKAEKGLLCDSERVVLGYGHDEIGGYLAAWWSLPQFIVQTARWHHEPSKSTGQGAVVTAVHVADALAQEFGMGHQGDHRSLDVDKERWDRYDLTPETLTEMQGALQELESVG